MANRIDSHFNDFGGIDSRTNQMVQNPKTARDGRNFEFRTDGAQNDFDVLAKRRGFQRKAEGGSAAVGLIKYVYRDLNTGEQKTEILGVNSAGELKKSINSIFYIVNTSGQDRYYSFFYDESINLWKFEIYNQTKIPLGSITFNDSFTLENLKTSINAISVTTGVSSTSNPITLNVSIKAHFLEVRQFEYLKPVTLPAFSLKETVYYWQNVLVAGANPLFEYISGASYLNNPEFAGISYVNLNNSVYMTDGGFPIKYDGYAAYRAGMPHTVGTKTTTATSTDSSPDGFVLTATTGGSMPSSTTYKYKFQLGFVDPNGFEVLGKINDQMLVALNASQNAVQISVPPIRRSSQFPTFAAKVNGNQNLNNTTLTFNVASGHNIVSGMILRIPVSNSLLGLGGFSYFYPVVDSVTATTITIESCPFIVPPDNPFSTGSTLRNGQWIQAGFGPSNLNAKVTDPVQKAASLLIPDVLVGAFVRVYRTAGNTDIFYRLIDLPLQYYDGTSSPGDKYNFLDTYPNTGGSGARLSTELLDESEGEELPRACAFLSKWQNQLVQAGRPYNPDFLKNSFYPTNYFGSALVNGWSQPIIEDPLYIVTEALLCDSQSIYWSDSLNPEGFPQSGLNEESFETPYADQVSGMGESKDSFFVFKDRSMFILNGELATGNIRKERYEADIGCASHNSIVSVMGGLMWLDATHGFCAVIANQMPRIIGYPVQDWQKTNPFKSSSDQLKFPTARAVNDLIGNKYICYISKDSGDLTFVYDYGERRNCWYIWSGIEASGGFIYHQDAVWFGKGDFLWKQKKSGSRYDFSDHTSAISFIFKSAWLNFKAYSIDKKWVQAIIHSARRGFSVLVSQYYNYIDTKEGEILLTFDEASTASPKRTIALNKLKSLSFSLGLENSTINQDVSLNGWEIQFSAEYDKGEAKS